MKKKNEGLEENNRASKGQLVLYIIIILLLVLVIIILFQKKMNNVDQKIVDQYYSYLGSNDLALCGGLYLYGTDKVTEDLLDTKTKICNAYLNLDEKQKEKVVLDKTKDTNTCKYKKTKFAVDDYQKDECTIEKITKEDIAASYKKIYGKTIDNLEEFYISDNEICRVIDGEYYCGLTENFVYSLKESPKTYRTVLKTEKTDDAIEIYDIMLRILDKKCYGGFESEDEIEKCSKKFSKKEEVDYKMLEKYGFVYKHTFVKNEETGEYYWLSSELV